MASNDIPRVVFRDFSTQLFASCDFPYLNTERTVTIDPRLFGQTGLPFTLKPAHCFAQCGLVLIKFPSASV